MAIVMLNGRAYDDDDELLERATGTRDDAYERQMTEMEEIIAESYENPNGRPAKKEREQLRELMLEWLEDDLDQQMQDVTACDRAQTRLIIKGESELSDFSDMYD